MPACSTASLGALSLSASSLGQAFVGPSPQCAELSADVARNPSLYNEAWTFARAAGCSKGIEGGGGGAPAPGGDGGNGNGGTGIEDVLVSLFGAVPGVITAIRGPAGGPPRPGYAPAQARRAGMGMLGLVAVGVVVWMVAQGGRRD